ncbi:uncharacterized protein BJ171DRAFT_627289 [Polychytrium aggregatum]|uniref:uncharacterized protein n=1 Tax=Polychytrium aggregatum TaxID=110093 RepID=UPI0022FE3770|nr:uncharacterized protein BJ171DRAFT_627289 [Polychytrium aggregatum]KAI9209090.1 hypothetical protein BJ171DRAFT_627289 [Polychytrium aggregatum]
MTMIITQKFIDELLDATKISTDHGIYLFVKSPLDKVRSFLVNGYEPHEAKKAVVVFGNPGTGKSTLLNSLIGKIVFKSGIAVDGVSLTKAPESTREGNILYVDTPGIDEVGNIGEKSSQLSSALSTGLPTILVGVIRGVGGRINAADLATVLIVFLAVQEKYPRRQSHDVIIINKVPKSADDSIMNPITNVIIRECHSKNVGAIPIWIRSSSDAHDENDALLNPHSIHNLCVHIKENDGYVIPAGSYFYFDGKSFKEIIESITYWVVRIARSMETIQGYSKHLIKIPATLKYQPQERQDDHP